MVGLVNDWEVSILLFVDVALEESGDYLGFQSRRGFNPSFRGCGS